MWIHILFHVELESCGLALRVKSNLLFCIDDSYIPYGPRKRHYTNWKKYLMKTLKISATGLWISN